MWVCESRGYEQRVQAEARKAQVGVSDQLLVEHAAPTMIQPIIPHRTLPDCSLPFPSDSWSAGERLQWRRGTRRSGARL